MTKHTTVPILVKVLEIYDDWQWGRIHKTVIGKRLHVGKYYVAEHSKTPGLNEGDAFIIKEVYDNLR